MPTGVSGSAHIEADKITFTLRTDVENRNLDGANLRLTNGNPGIDMIKHGEHLTVTVPKDQRVDPPGDAITMVRYDDFVAAIESGAGLELVLNIQTPLLAETVQLRFKSEGEHHRYEVVSASG